MSFRRTYFFKIVEWRLAVPHPLESDNPLIRVRAFFFRQHFVAELQRQFSRCLDWVRVLGCFHARECEGAYWGGKHLIG